MDTQTERAAHEIAAVAAASTSRTVHTFPTTPPRSLTLDTLPNIWLKSIFIGGSGTMIYLSNPPSLDQV
jgi:hypothetical protein